MRGSTHMGWAAAIVGVLLLAPAPARGEGLAQGTLSFQGRERSYYYHLPPAARGPAKLPLLLALHGGGRADGDEYAKRTGYDAIADREGFIVVYSDGVDAQWNDGRGKTFRRAKDDTNVDDVGFIDALIERFVARHGVDPARVYVEGSSNGGMMAQRLACELSGKLAAVASVIPSMRGAVAPLGRPSGEVLATADTIRFWRTHDGCNATARIEALPDRNTKDRSSVQRYVWAGCRDGAQVVLYEVVGGGHSRPGMHGRVPQWLLGPKNGDLDASEVIWSFLASFRR